MEEEFVILKKKKSSDERNFKSDDEIKAHFLLRLKERYDIILSDKEYNNLHHSGGFSKSTILTNMTPWLKISSNYSSFIITIKEKYVLVIYSKHRGRFITALPWESYDDHTRLVPKVFKKTGLKELATERYEKILSICAKEYVDLGNSKDNWYHYQNNCTYPSLLMTEYLGRLTMGHIYAQVTKELFKEQDDLIQFI